MKKQLLCLCAVAGMGMALQAAEGQNESGYYTRFGVGVAFQGDIKVKELAGTKLPVTLNETDLATFLDDTFGINLGTIPAGNYTISKPKFKMDTGLRLDADFGYHIDKSWALELETGLTYNSIKSIEVAAVGPGGPATGKQGNVDVNLYQIPILANVIYTLPLEGNLKPYVGAGAGGVLAIVDGSGVSESDFTFAWQVMAGADYKFNENWSAGLAYKLLGTGEANWGDVKTDSFLTHSIMASVTFNF